MQILNSSAPVPKRSANIVRIEAIGCINLGYPNKTATPSPDETRIE